MRQPVREAFPNFTAGFEGSVDRFYLDAKGLITIGRGDLFDGPTPETSLEGLARALLLPMVWLDGSLATRADISTAWHLVKNHQELKGIGGGNDKFKALTQIRLTPAGMDAILWERANANDADIAKRFLQFNTWPCDAQLAIVSVAWACGSYGADFEFPRMDAALNAMDFNMASIECHMDTTGNPELELRNIANKRLFTNAAVVVRDGLDPTKLYYPLDLTRGTLRA